MCIAHVFATHIICLFFYMGNTPERVPAKITIIASETDSKLFAYSETWG